MRTALITGARGFTGRYMAAALQARGYRVVGLVNGAADSEGETQCDLTDAASVRALVTEIRPEVVVHLAAISFVAHEPADDFYRVNLFGTLNLLEALAGTSPKPRKILIASSANVYGNLGVEVISESMCPKPVNHYAVSKLAMEHMVGTWFARLPIVITRPFNYTGPGQGEQFLIPKIVSHFKRREPVIELGNLNVSRDFSDVRDVVDTYVRLLENDVVSDIVNVCSGRAISLREIITNMNIIAGYAIDVRVNPQFVRSSEIVSLRGDRSLLERISGGPDYRPIDVTLKHMFESTID